MYIWKDIEQELKGEGGIKELFPRSRPSLKILVLFIRVNFAFICGSAGIIQNLAKFKGNISEQKL